MIKTINLDFEVLAQEFHLDRDLEQFTNKTKIYFNDNRAFCSITKKRSNCYLELKKVKEKWEFFLSFKDCGSKIGYFVSDKMIESTGSTKGVYRSTASDVITFFLENKMEEHIVLDFIRQIANR